MKIKKIAIILIIIAVVSLICFAISVAILGVKDNNWSVSVNGNSLLGIDGGNDVITFINGKDMKQNVYYGFEPGETYKQDYAADEITSVELNIITAEAVVSSTKNDTATVTYTASDVAGHSFTARCVDGVLSVSEENGSFSLFSFGESKRPRIEVLLPEKVYEKVTVTGASGSLRIDGITAESLDSKVSSGGHDYKVTAKEISLRVSSGSVELNPLTEERAESLTIKASSGSISSGYPTDKLNLEVSSGELNVTGASGDTDIDVSSGDVNVKFDEWNGDLKVHTTSGKVEALLPAGSGADVTLSRTSGSADITLDGEKADIGKSGSASIGGSNRHNINISLTSGSVSVHN